MDLCELEASLVYQVSSRTTRATQRNPVLRKREREREREREEKLYLIEINVLPYGF